MRVNFKYFALLLLLLIGMNSAFAQWDTTWQQTYGGNRDDFALDIISTTDKGFMLIGSTSSFGFDNSQMYFLKLDTAGNIMWSKSHGGEGQEWGTSVIQTSDGGYLGVGYTNSWGEGGFDVFLVKLDSIGNLEYEAVKGGFDWEFAWDVIELSPGKYIIAAETQSFGNGDSDGWLLQFDEPSRTWDWETTVGTSSTENFKSVTVGNNNDFFAVGLGHGNTPLDDDIMLVRFNSNGDPLSTYFYGDTLLDYGNAIVKMSNGTYGITGVREVPTIPPGVGVLRVDSLGNQFFDKNWSASTFQFGEGKVIMEMPNDRFCIGGMITKNNGDQDLYLAYSLPTGEFFNVGNTHGSNFTESGGAALYLGNQGFIIAGFTNGYDASFQKVLVVKTDSLVKLDSPHAFKQNIDSVNITSVKHLNPVNKSIKYNTSTNMISINNVFDSELIVIDLSGKIITQRRFNSNFDVNSLNIKSGAYIIKIYNNSSIWTSLIIKN